MDKHCLPILAYISSIRYAVIPVWQSALLRLAQTVLFPSKKYTYRFSIKENILIFPPVKRQIDTHTHMLAHMSTNWVHAKYTYEAGDTSSDGSNSYMTLLPCRS